MGNGHMETPFPVDNQTHMSENITLPQIRWRTVNIGLSDRIQDYPEELCSPQRGVYKRIIY